jgi:hypothetical protein
LKRNRFDRVQLRDEFVAKIIREFLPCAVIERRTVARADQAAVHRFRRGDEHALLEGEREQHADDGLVAVIVEARFQAIGVDRAAARGAEDAGAVDDGRARVLAAGKFGIGDDLAREPGFGRRGDPGSEVGAERTQASHVSGVDVDTVGAALVGTETAVHAMGEVSQIEYPRIDRVQERCAEDGWVGAAEPDRHQRIAARRMVSQRSP